MDPTWTNLPTHKSYPLLLDWCESLNINSLIIMTVDTLYPTDKLKLFSLFDISDMMTFSRCQMLTTA